MNEGKKTLVFWAAAAAMLAIGSFVAWPTPQSDSNPIAGSQLFEKFTDPQSAASMKIVTFDEDQGRLETFEVRRDRETGLWNIPSRDGYPADAIEQMRTAANALVDLKILDVQTSNAEDHDDLGVAEPNLEDLEVGDEGVGRLVTFKNDSQETLASIIIGDQDKSDPEKRFVRIPGQDPVYVVKLDQSSLSTNFEDWIEKDLLKLSSIDIAEMELQDYTASIAGNQLALDRNYTALVELDGTEWKLKEYKVFDDENPAADPTPVELGEDDQLNKAKLDAMKNALDDLKIADVVRKPDGMSANLRANKDFLNDRESVMSLQRNGFFPARSSAEGDVEIISANGEMSVTLKDGVKYLMRFGDIESIAEDPAADDADSAPEDDGTKDEESTAGVNRYLLVTAMVNQAKFPPPELREVPKTIDDLRALLEPPTQESPADDESAATESDETESTSDSEVEPEMEEEADTESVEEKETDEPAKESSETDSETEPEPAAEGETEGEAEVEGGGEATGSGEAQEADATASDDESAEGVVAEEPSEAAAAESSDEPSDESSDDPADQPSVAAEDLSASPLDGLNDGELQERLEAEQEKITKENQRKLDERKDKIEAAEKKVQELNSRFADWYYVISEDTYAKLKIKQDDFFQEAADVVDSPNGSPAAGPQFQIPGVPGN